MIIMNKTHLRELVMQINAVLHQLRVKVFSTENDAGAHASLLLQHEKVIETRLGFQPVYISKKASYWLMGSFPFISFLTPKREVAGSIHDNSTILKVEYALDVRTIE